MLVGGTAVFLALAIAEQWSFFAAAWFSPKAPAVAKQGCPPAALEAVERFLAGLPGFYADPASTPALFRDVRLTAPLIGEMMADSYYLSARGWRQEMALLSHSIVGTKELPKGRWEVTADESWSIKLAGEPGDGGRISSVRCRYVVGLVQGRWTLGGWELEPPPAGEKP